MTHAKTKPRDITLLLRRYAEGDLSAMNELAGLVYDRLREMARYKLKGENSGHTLQPTALANEVFAELLQDGSLTVENRRQFFALAATAMRRFLIDHARMKNAGKRGSGGARVSFDERFHVAESFGDLVELDRAMSELANVDERVAKVVELKVFGGLEIEEIATVLQTSSGTVKRDWAKAKLWLARMLK